MKRQRLIVFGLVSVIALIGLVAMAGPNTAIFKAILVQNDAAIGNDLQVGGAVTYGSGGLYPVGSATNSKIFQIGATGAMTQTIMTPAAMTTVTAYGCNVNAPSAAAQLCYSSLSGKTLTFKIYNSAATPAAISTPHSGGASYWIAGN